MQITLDFENNMKLIKILFSCTCSILILKTAENKQQEIKYLARCRLISNLVHELLARKDRSKEGTWN